MVEAKTPGSGALAGAHVVVTRPAAQAEPLCRMIEQAGGRALRFPVLEILDAADVEALLHAIDALDEFDIAVFISPNAVNKVMNLLVARRSLPPGLRIAAVGRGSARELKRFGVEAHLYPRQRFDSEALLALPGMQAVDGKRVVIFRGDGGRERLGDELRGRGARVHYVEAYRRRRPGADVDQLLKHWARGEVDIIVVTSVEGLRNLFDMVGKLGQQWLRKASLLVISERIAEHAAELGFQRPAVVAPEASDEGVLAALIEWWANRP